MWTDKIETVLLRWHIKYNEYPNFYGHLPQLLRISDKRSSITLTLCPEEKNTEFFSKGQLTRGLTLTEDS